MEENSDSYIKWENKIKKRTDLTLFLTHLTKPKENLHEIRESLKDRNNKSEFKRVIYERSVDRLIKILKEEKLVGNADRKMKGNIPVVCFQEVPWNLLNEIEEEVWREVEEKGKPRYCGVGISFHKFFLYSKEVRPVIYDTKYDFLKDRVKYNQLSKKTITDQKNYYKNMCTMYDNKYYDMNFKLIELSFMEKVISLYENIDKYNFDDIKKSIKELSIWRHSELFKLKYNDSFTLEEEEIFKKYIANIDEGIFSKSNKSESKSYSLISEQNMLLWNLFEYIKLIDIEEIKKKIKSEIINYNDNYFKHKTNEINGDNFIWKLVEFKLTPESKIIDYTFEREWRKKNNLSFSLEEMNTKSNEMILIFPNKNIYEYFQSKIAMEEKLECLKDIKLYNSDIEYKGISYIILEELNNNLATSVSRLMKEQGVSEEIIGEVISKLEF